VPSHAFMSPPATRLFCTAGLLLAFGALPAPASAAPQGRADRAASHAARTAQRAQARADRRLQREERKAARLAQRATRIAEREERRAMRAAKHAERIGAGEGSASATPNGAAALQGDGEAAESGRGGTPLPSPPGDCTLTAQASSHQVTAGETVTISGRLSCPSAVNAGGQEVSVSERGPMAAQPGLNLAGTATTEADGSYQFHSTELKGRSVFVARTPSAQHAARVAVIVVGAVSLQGPVASAASLPMSAGKAAGGPAGATFTGAVQPAESGRLVALKVRYAGGEWRTVAYTRTDSDGRFTFAHRFRFAGEVSVMAASRPRGTVRTQSQPLTYTIVQAQNPAITIQAAAASLASPQGLAAGVPIDITGVAVASPHQTVTLLSRSPSGQFTSTATAQSDGAGAYSFTVAPTQTTIYAVRCGKSRSTIVRREVS
jgi:hypothetical protein